MPEQGQIESTSHSSNGAVDPSGGRRFLRRSIASGLLGLGALALVLVAFVVTQSNQDIRPIVIVVYLAFFLAAFFSPRPIVKAVWIGGLIVFVSGILPMLVLRELGLALTDNLYLAVVVLTAVVAVSVAVAVRWLGSRRKFGYAILLVCVAFSVAAACALSIIPQIEDRLAYVTVSKPIAPFVVRSLDGVDISSDSLRGRVVVLSYWATWCPPCMAELPKIASLQNKYRADPRVAVIALNAGYGGDTPERARSFLLRRNFSVSTDIDDIKTNGSTKGAAAASLGLKVVPTLFILNKAGRLVAIHTGYDNSEKLLESLPRIIEQLVVEN